MWNNSESIKKLTNLCKQLGKHITEQETNAKACDEFVTREEMESNKEVMDAYKQGLVGIQKDIQIMQKSVTKLIDSVISDDDYEVMAIEKPGDCVDIAVNNGHFIIIINEKMAHRKTYNNIRITYEKAILEKAAHIKNDIAGQSDVVVIYEHVYKLGIDGSKVYDNDNYNQAQCKQILDALATAGIIDNDEGLNCFIMHMATKGEADQTRIHVISKAKFGEVFNSLINQ